MFNPLHCANVQLTPLLIRLLYMFTYFALLKEESCTDTYGPYPRQSNIIGTTVEQLHSESNCASMFQNQPIDNLSLKSFFSNKNIFIAILIHNHVNYKT